MSEETSNEVIEETETEQTETQEEIIEDQPKNQTFVSKCETCKFETTSKESQEKSDELLDVHLLSHTKPETKQLEPRNPMTMSLTSVIAISLICFAIGFGLMFAQGKKKYSDDTKRKNQ